MTKPTSNGATNGVAKPQANGQNDKPELSKLTVNAAPNGTTEVKDTEKGAPVVNLQENKPLSISDRLKKLDKLNKLNERRSDLVDALDDVNGFILSPASPAKITFTDGKGNTFSVSHQGVIGDMVDLAKKRLENEISTVDSQITFD